MALKATVPASMTEALLEQGFLLADDDEIKVRLAIEDGKVVLVIFAHDARRVAKLLDCVDPSQVRVELCG
jgi:hypothetical protein